jgi:hypothetical protein
MIRWAGCVVTAAARLAFLPSDPVITAIDGGVGVVRANLLTAMDDDVFEIEGSATAR